MIHQKGFTLIELAIALMVIGLLIGGVLKGQELIQNAKVTQTIRQFDSYKTAVMIFNASYNALLGDIRQPNRIPGCTVSPCSDAGNGNGILEPPRCCIEYYSAAQQYTFQQGGDGKNFWRHLAKAGLISSVQSGDGAVNASNPGEYFPGTPWDGSLWVHMHYWTSRCVTGVGCFAANGIGIQPITQTAASKAAVPVRAAAAIDRKLDDGKPYFQGEITINDDWRVGFTATSLSCATVRDLNADYNEANTGGSCNMFFALPQ